VSPHYDDAALSCSALLDRAEPLTVLDVFTQVPEPEQHTEWDRLCGFEGSSDAFRARVAEEAAAFAGTPHELLEAGLLDAQYRPGLLAEQDAARLVGAIEGWVDRCGAPCTVALPAGAGLPVGSRPTLLARLRARRAGHATSISHADHLAARDIGVELLRARPDVTIWLYEELPYLWSRRADAVVPLVARWAERDAELVTLAVDRERKAVRLAAYASQLPRLFADTAPDRLARRLPVVERYWSLPPEP
jgi:LmbE family N-acetylglucosaminyl deacetylase